MRWWKFMLVLSGVEHLRIMRDGSIHYEGTVWAGFTMRLTLGDSVLMKVNGRRWLKKFDLCLHRGRPALHFGNCYGKKNTYVDMNSLPHIPGVTYRGRRRHASRDGASDG